MGTWGRLGFGRNGQYLPLPDTQSLQEPAGEEESHSQNTNQRVPSQQNALYRSSCGAAGLFQPDSPATVRLRAHADTR